MFKLLSLLSLLSMPAFADAPVIWSGTTAKWLPSGLQSAGLCKMSATGVQTVYTTDGIVKMASGVPSAASAGTDYQAAGSYITAVTGDLTATGPGSVTGTLATVNASPGTTAISTVTTNGKGLVTANTAASTTGSGSVVLASGPTLVSPILGAATATSINKMAITAPATSSTLAVADGKTLTASNTLTLVGTDGSTLTFGTGGTVTYTANKLSVFAATTSSEFAGVISDETGSGLLVFGTAPTLSNPIVGTQSLGDSSTKAASTAFVQSALAQLNPAAAVKAASTANIPGTYTNSVGGVCVGDTFQVTATTAFAPDGITLTVGQRFLMKDQSSGFQNGVWTLTTAANVGVLGALLTRALDWDSSADMNAGSLVPVISGTLNANTVWYQTAAITTCNSDSQVYTKFSGGSASPALTRFTLAGAAIPYVAINGTHYQQVTQSLTAVYISMLDSGTSGSTTIQVNQYRSGSLQGSATASLSASSGTPTGASSNLSGTLSLLAGDIITVDVNSVATGTPSELTVEF